MIQDKNSCLDFHQISANNKKILVKNNEVNFKNLLVYENQNLFEG
jgi:hypothetical protein